MKKKMLIAVAGAAVAFVGAGIWAWITADSSAADGIAKPTVTTENGKTIKTFTLVAEETEWEIAADKKVEAWTYNGTVPGSQLRVQQGDIVRVELKNKLKEPVSIHWHGYPVPNNMDGIPGMTQNAVRPNETFTYLFEATIPGTYWYHSHQDSANQVDKGLYGTLIVEDSATQKLNRDYTLVLDEWMTQADGASGGMNHGGMDHGQMNMGTNETMAGMDHSQMQMNNQATASLPPGAMHDQMMQTMYNTFTVNGKSGEAITPLAVEKGDNVRLRFVNAGYQSHLVSLQDQPYRIVGVDGQTVNSPQTITGQPLRIAPGERYDVEFTVEALQNWQIESLDQSAAAKQMSIPIVVKGATGKVEQGVKQTKPVDLSTYGADGTGKFTLKTNYDLTYQMDLGEKPGKTEMDAVFTINGKAYGEVPPLVVKKGDKVLVTMRNVGSSDHPMHLHGHFFQVLQKDGQPIAGAPIMKDTLNVKPGETYVVAFEADNPGDWMFHCHDLHHAAAGMVSEVKYAGYKSFVPDPSVGNKPE
ncbi:multicopper oxidase family protein [Brevibacillus fluminis]|uniref:Multicopper oxidase family protein n=1 Tax=Brevibacillus fluminis TaxID=511487 RepID=A0A3M8D9A7_9BACL|nr:multicopper oxidase family protein [Brevibacillus fluminis]RNB84622.1 multicopper oxidase family protein [Brevibacillus fluminis]